MTQEILPLWPDAGGDAEIPSLSLFPCDATPRGGVMVLPGGGYHHLADHEGAVIAEQLNAAGFDAAVLRYRLAPDHQHPAMINDAQRGMRLMRQHPAIGATRLAVLGFSAGGDLASTLAVHGERFTTERDDLAGQYAARPDAVVLCYPVIDMADPYAHAGSRLGLLGESPDADLVQTLSNHRQVDANTPPTFLWHTAEDDAVPVHNSLMFAAACRDARVPVELHVYESGGHGLGLAADHAEAKAWWPACVSFLGRHLAAD
ncbi:MAG: alpha/beta hydrolase [Planctomycetota bacterium]